MHHLSVTYSIFPLGDSAITIDLGNCIDEQLNIKALAIHDWLQAHRFPGVLDILVAYSSVTILYDTALVWANKKDCREGVFLGLEKLLKRAWGEAAGVGEAGRQGKLAGHFFRLPVCYEGEYAPDLDGVAREKDITTAEVITLHTSEIYRIYMVGFLPGFPYMGKINDQLKIPRKKQPANIVAGGVGIAGRQTGIYPLNSPGGWQVIGRTPVRLFDVRDVPPIRLQAGDRVQFYPVTKKEFDRWRTAADPVVPDSMPFQ